MPMFDLDQFAADCRAAVADRAAAQAVREVVARAVEDRAQSSRRSASSARGGPGPSPIGRSDDPQRHLGPKMTIMPTITRCGRRRRLYRA